MQLLKFANKKINFKFFILIFKLIYIDDEKHNLTSINLFFCIQYMCTYTRLFIIDILILLIYYSFMCNSTILIFKRSVCFVTFILQLIIKENK